MSDRAIDLNLDPKSVAKTIFGEPTPEEVAQYEARMVQIYDNGLIIDRLQVTLPDGIHGEWVHPDFADRLREFGFINAPNDLLPKSLNDNADGSKKAGDVIFMILPKWRKDVMDKNRDRKYYDNHIKDRRRKKEEKEFEDQNEMPTTFKGKETVNSEMNVVSGTEIESILKAR